MQYRHGDVMIERIESLPGNCRLLQHTILAHGEVTGHSHRIQEHDDATLFESTGSLFLEVNTEKVSVVHEEHATIELPNGFYRIWRQREYSPEEIRIIRD